MPSKLVRALATLGQQASANIGNLATRLDGWTNDVTGFGTDRDKTTYGRFVAHQYLDDVQKSDLYHFDDMAARMVDVVPDELYREGFSLVAEGNPDLSSALNAKFADINVRQKFAEAKRWGRCFGGAAAIIGCDDGRDASQELRPTRAKGISWLEVVDKRDLIPFSYYSEPGSFEYGKPKTYLVSVCDGTGAMVPRPVHESRLIFFGGAATADRERRENQGWDLSVLQRPYEVLRQFNTGWQSVENLLTDAHQAIYKMSGLANAIAQGGGDYLKRRGQLMDMGRSVVRALIIDAGDPSAGEPSEEFSRQSVSFSDIPAILDKYMLRLAASVRMPVTILMGQSPAGMNATGESDFRWFYDQIRAEQSHSETPRLQDLAYLWLQTKEGGGYTLESMPVVTVEWASLWTETPATEATRRKTIIEGDALAISNGVYTANEVALARTRPGGFDQEIQLTPDGIKAREQALRVDLEEIGGERREPTADESHGERVY